MKRITKCLSLLLAIVMFLQLADTSIVYAAEEVEKALDPAGQIELRVPESLQDGGSYFFIREDHTISENSSEKLYIPIQRTGDISSEADITLKLVDMTAHFGVNYDAEIYHQKIEPTVEYDGVAMVDAFLNADSIEEVDLEELADEAGQAVYDAGGADFVGADGEVIGSVSAYPLDGDGNSDQEAAEETEAPEPGEEMSLREARDAYTGTVSDRQQLAGGDSLTGGMENLAAASGVLGDQAQESYPGREYALHFEAEEEAVFLVITPKYSEAADGDSTIMLLLKDQPEGASVPEDFNMRSVLILDEDEPEEVVISFAEPEIRAEDGSAAIKVTRQGRVNAMVGVYLSSNDGTAKAGDDYSGVGAKLWFPMGITERTVELPVGHGTEEKDFNLYINTLPEAKDVSIGTSSAHVVIPAAEPGAELLAAKDADRLGEEWDMQDRMDEKTDQVQFKDGGATVFMKTKIDKCCGEYIDFYTPRSYAWDGVHVSFKVHTWYSMIEFIIRKWQDGEWTDLYDKKYGDCATKDNQTQDVYYNSEEGPAYLRFKDWCYEVHNGFRDSYTDLTLYSIEPIKRKFTVSLKDPVLLNYQGMTDAQVLKNYQTAILDSSMETKDTYWTGDYFSVSRLSAQEWSRLTGLVAVAPDGRTKSLGSIDGKTGSVNVQLSESTINSLAEGGYITWKKSGSSYSGSIDVRPVFSYVKDITVKIRDSGYGGAALKAEPALRWDFGADNLMDAKMGANSKNAVSWAGEQDADGNDYYTFTAAGGDPYVSIDTPAATTDLQWVTVRAKNLCGAKAIELYGRFNNSGPNAESCVHVDLEQDQQWHTYLVNIPEENVRTVNAYKGTTINRTAWTGSANWLRIDPMWKEGDGGMSSGDQIQIDYVEFFPTKAEAEKSAGRVLAPGTYTFHYGDKLTFVQNSTVASANDDLRPVGMGYQSRKTGAAGALTGQTDCSYYITNDDPYVDDEPTYTLTQDYYEFWQVFSDEGNAVQVRVAENDLQYFDATKGILADAAAGPVTGGYRYYTVKPSVVTNELIDLSAEAKDSENVPTWILPNDKTVYSGSTFWFHAGVRAADNVVTLGVDRSASNHAYYSFSGTAYTSTLNLSSGHDAGDVIPVQGVAVMTPRSGGVSMEEGDFDLPAVYLVGGTTMRYLVSYNGQTDIREVKLAPADAAKTTANYEGPDGGISTVQAVPVTLGSIKVDTWVPGGARFSEVTVNLGGFNATAISAVELNGKKLEVSVKVQPGSGYMTTDKNGNTVTVPENIVDVRLYFQSTITGEIHGEYSVNAEEEKYRLAWDAATNTAKLTIREFKPDAPELYTYGDVLMAELITDRQTGVNKFMDWVMVYQPVSTGFAVIADQDYVPTTFNYDVNIAEMLDSSIEGVQDDEGGNRRANFGQFPFFGAITAAVKVFTYYSSANKYSEAKQIIDDLEDMDESGELGGDDAELMESVAVPTKWTMSALVVMKDNYYNGMRILVGVAMTTGNGKYQKRANPYRSFKSTQEYTRGDVDIDNPDNLIMKSGPQNTKAQNRNVIKSEFGGGYITFSVYVGFYLDFGYIEIMDEEENGKYEISHDIVFMGAGGFIGAQFTAGYTWYIFPWGIPMYANLEAMLRVTLFLGASADPNKTLEKAYYDNDQQTGEDWGFNLEVDGRAGVYLTLGAGFAKVASVRATGGLGLHAGYSLRMSDWFPNLTGANTLSFATDAMFSGGIDTPFGSYDLWSASWPLPWGYGWLQYFQQMTRANNLIHFIKQNIDEGYCPERYRAEAQTRVDELAAYVDQYTGDGPILRKKVNALQSWAEDHHALGATESRRVDAIRMGGLIGNIMEAVMLTDGEDPSNQNYHVNDHVDSSWVAGDDASLMAAFGPVESRKLMDNAPSQPSSQIIALGGNRFLVAFLDDDTSRERQQAWVLKYTVYDANAGTWTEPKAIQNDGTGDSQANLVDAGEKIIISWTSIVPEKLQALKDEVAAEYKRKTGYTATEDQILLELEADPARLLELMDVFTVQFDKNACTLGSIEQLTDDDFYDAGPQAVYDNKTGDYIILYSKTSQDREDYATSGDRFENMISGNPDDKTYSVMAYMLYNNQTEAKDTRGNTHEPGWARDYYFPNETDEDLASQDFWLEQYGGQRFLSSALREEDGGQIDMPISDLTVARGYNGLAAYAFTVDKDYNLDTNDDRDLFVQFYRFSDHSTYVPIKVAGEKKNYILDRGSGEFTGTAMKEVGVAQPKLIRSGGSTWLFWRQADEGLYYMNISELLNAQVAVAPEESGDGDWYYDGNTEMTYAVKADGSFAVDGTTGEPYQPDIQKVDFGSALTDGKLTATDYQVVTDKDDNLYVVWNDTSTYQAPVDEKGEMIVTHPTLGIYASAMIKEETPDEDEDDGAADLATWSKPYLMTRDHTSNDGLAIALDESDGSLIIVHNQYEMLFADTEEEQLQMVEKGLAGIQVNEEEGKAYFVGYPFYPTEISLMLTRFAPIGSVEATQFEFSDETPVANQTVSVAAAIENTGLTTAEGCEIKVYEYKDGRRGKEIYSTSSDEPLRVNKGKKITFPWTIPADGPEGYCLQTVIREKKADGGFYEAIENFSDPFELTSEYEPVLEQCVQNGDGFDVKFHVTNTGNEPAPEGTTVDLILQALHGDLKERYGMDDDRLITEDISGLAPGETKEVVKTITLPVSVFRFCGYDAVTVSVMDQDEELQATTDQELIILDAPINLSLNGNQPIAVEAGKTAQADLDYDSTVFIDAGGSVSYTVADPSIASVDAEGKVTGLSDGTTTLTATVMPSGRSKSVKLQVGEGCRKDASCPISRYTDSDPKAWYHDGVHWALDEGVMNGVAEDKFAPNTPTSRAMIVTMLYRMEGEPEVGTKPSFTDVPEGKFYTKAVAWAFANKIVDGYNPETFGPNNDLTREQLVTILERYAKYKGLDVSKGEEAYLTGFTDADTISNYAVKAFRWAVDAGIINGMTKTTLSPKTNATRAQVATMLMRFDNLK